MSLASQVAANSELANSPFFARWSERRKNRSDRKRQERAEWLWALENHNQEIAVFEQSQICRCGVSLYHHNQWQKKAWRPPSDEISSSCPAFLLDFIDAKEK